MDQIRRRRLEELILEQTAFMITAREIKDPRVGPLVSISRVEASPDGAYAKVWVSILGDSDRELDGAVEGLNSAAGFIQSQIARRTRLRLTPVLRFIADRGIREGFDMVETLRGLAGE